MEFNSKVIKTELEMDGCLYDLYQIGVVEGNTPEITKDKYLIREAVEWILNYKLVCCIQVIAGKGIYYGVWKTITQGDQTLIVSSKKSKSSCLKTLKLLFAGKKKQSNKGV